MSVVLLVAALAVVIVAAWKFIVWRGKERLRKTMTIAPIASDFVRLSRLWMLGAPLGPGDDQVILGFVVGVMRASANSAQVRTGNEGAWFLVRLYLMAESGKEWDEVTPVLAQLKQRHQEASWKSWVAGGQSAMNRFLSGDARASSDGLRDLMQAHANKRRSVQVHAAINHSDE